MRAPSVGPTTYLKHPHLQQSIELHVHAPIIHPPEYIPRLDGRPALRICTDTGAESDPLPEQASPPLRNTSPRIPLRRPLPSSPSSITISDPSPHPWPQNCATFPEVLTQSKVTRILQEKGPCDKILNSFLSAKRLAKPATSLETFQGHTSPIFEFEKMRDEEPIELSFKR